jgi:hypothetical protein
MSSEAFMRNCTALSIQRPGVSRQSHRSIQSPTLAGSRRSVRHRVPARAASMTDPSIQRDSEPRRVAIFVVRNCGVALKRLPYDRVAKLIWPD